MAGEPDVRRRVRPLSVSGREVSESSSHYKLLQQTRDEARWTWRIASASFLVALLSLGAFLSCSRTEEPALTQFPSDMEEVTPGWAWTTVPAIVRQERSLQSKKVGIVKAASRVLVKEVRGIRARITEPMAGWISCVSGNVQVVTRHETDEHIKKVKREVMAHQKTQRDLLTALENVKRKGGIHPKLFGKVRPQNESAEFDGTFVKGHHSATGQQAGGQ
ncbi:unnamed protein product [Durusdinium trenchii]|uniref:Uncharacterized protein n=2 Tax=Durusdinium trenchii TaxID=1381693 RepID=A0ABP0RT70_9DINO